MGLTAVSIATGQRWMDVTPLALEDCEWSRNEHGALTLSVTVRGDVDWASRVGRTEMRLASQWGEPVWRGRLTEARVTPEGTHLVAYGWWQAVRDLPLTDVYSDARLTVWEPLTVDDDANVTVARYEADKFNRLYIAPRGGEQFGSSHKFIYGYRVPHNGSLLLKQIAFDYVFANNGDTDWQVVVSRRNALYGVAATVTTITTAGSGSVSQTFAARSAVCIELYRNNATPATLAADSGAVYVKITNVRVLTTTISTLTTTAIVQQFIADINGVNATHLAAHTNQVETIANDLKTAIWEDAPDYGAALDMLAEQGHSGVQYETGVTLDKVLYFRARNSRSKTFIVDVADFETGPDVEQMRNSAYAVYEGVRRPMRTSVAADAVSVAQYGVTRRGVVDAKWTTSSTTADTAVTDYLAQYAQPRPRTRIEAAVIETRGGSAAPGYQVEPGDYLKIRNLPLYVRSQVGTLRVTRVLCKAATGRVQVEVADPLPTLAEP